jgi:hypothetical protein
MGKSPFTICEALVNTPEKFREKESMVDLLKSRILIDLLSRHEKGDLAADDGAECFDHHTQDADAEGDAEGDQVNGEKPVYYLRGIAKYAAEIEGEA